MDPERLRALLDDVHQGRMPVEEAVRELKELPFRSLGFAHADTHRHLRTGFPEVVLGQGKTATQIEAILRELGRGGSTVMATRVDPAAGPGIVARLQSEGLLAVHWPTPRIIVLGAMPELDRGRGPLVVLSAGTADLPVAEEAALTIELAGQAVTRVFDVGVAGLHRLLAYRELIEKAAVVVVVAGMEGALPSVVAGLFARPVIAVPTSVGYGASAGGFAALFTMLSSCAVGVSVVNIDNGFGAGQLAAMLNRKDAP